MKSEKEMDEIREDIDDSLNVKFIANAGVKDIVGRGLIYNDNVAIIELIKNSKDANSSKVILNFNNIINSNSLLDLEMAEPSIIIKDYGVGMSRLDIKDKWLNIAYSEKRNKKEHEYAGNKGVGRFSCDRLGTKLDLYTKSVQDDYLKISIDWTEFENKGQFDEISSIPLRIHVLKEDEFLNFINEDSFNTGTVLVIKDLRNAWSEQKIKKLIAEIEKFSPSLDNSFDVYFNSNVNFKDRDLSFKVNKKINNNILEKLSFKTTYIRSVIDENGEYLTTHLFFQGEIVYKYKARNPYSALKNISVEIHYLDSISKSYFTRSFRIKPNNYGSVFLYYNNFRISPYGNEKNDWLGLDQRKSQGTSRNLGTRDIIGRINITDKNDCFSVITSREGLAHNQAYYELVAYDGDEKIKLNNGKERYGYVTTIIRQLESFVVRGTDWNRLEDRLGKQLVVSAEDIIRNPERFRVKSISSESVKNEMEKLDKSGFDILAMDVNHDVISRIQSINDEKYRNFLYDFIEKTQDKSLEDLSPKEKGFVRKIIDSSKKQISAAYSKVEEAEIKTKQIENTLKIEKKKQAYLLATRRTLSEDADGLIHTIKINNIEIKEGLDSLIESIEYGEINKEDLISRLGAIKLYSIKSLKMAEIATRSGFDVDIDIRSVDIVQYIKEYINIYANSFGNGNLIVSFSGDEIEFIRSISVLNLSIVLDNFISNSVKWGADKLNLNFAFSDNKLCMLISDNGYGLSSLFFQNPDEIFNLGVRDEPPESISGSGIGLYYSRDLLKGMNAKVEFFGNNINLSGACFKVVFE